MTPDGILFLAALAIGVLCVLLWIFRTAHGNDGVVFLPSWMMFGWGGAAWGQHTIVIDRSTWSKTALIAHERCHQGQMARDGTLRFYWRYLTDKEARQDYEIEAYRVWVQAKPDDLWRCVRALTGSYGLGLTDQEAIELLTT
jgi:hypothetical protein